MSRPPPSSTLIPSQPLSSPSSRIGIYPGTFDPITVGHMDIIRRALTVVDKLIIGVAQDTGKAPEFEISQRSALVGENLKELGEAAARVEVRAFSGLLVNLANEVGAKILIRGIRAVSDFDYEFQMACMNSRLDPSIETVFLTASENTHFISSRFVKQIARLGGDISSFVSPTVAEHLHRHFKA